MGLSVNNFMLMGSYMLMTSGLWPHPMFLWRQATLVKEFASANFLSLNAQKCEVVVFGTARGGVTPECEVDGCVMPCSGVGKCLGFWWRDLLATRCVDENIKKARRAFFNFGSIGVFQGSLNPLSSVSVI